MTRIALQDVATIHGGGRLKLSGNDFIPAGVSAYGAGGQNGFVATAEYDDREAVILSSIGARCGKCFHVHGAWTSLANTQVILPDPAKVDARFLWYQLNDERRWPRSGSAQPFIKPSDVKIHSVWLPSLDEQRRIATMLDQADALRAKRRQTLAHLDELPRSVFLDMFGRTSWPMTTVEEITSGEKGTIRTGPFGSQLLHSEFADEGIAVLGIDNVVTNRFRWSERRYITPEKYEKLKRYTVAPGDVLITIMGTCGRCVVVPDHIPAAINTKHLCAITVDPEKALPEFIRACFLWHPESRRHLLRRAKGSVMDGLNMGIIRDMPVPLAALDLQVDLVRRLRAVESHREVIASADADVARLFDSLQQRAFSGAL